MRKRRQRRDIHALQVKAALIHLVADDGGLMDGSQVRRVHALTTDGRTFQHRRPFKPYTGRLKTFLAEVEARVESQGYQLSSLNPTHWEDVTDHVFKQAGLQ